MTPLLKENCKKFCRNIGVDEQRELDKENIIATKKNQERQASFNATETNQQQHYGVQEGEEEDEEDKENEEPRAVDKILPPLPAAQREVFLTVEAVMGLMPPFAAIGNPVSAKVFWGGQEVRATPWLSPRGLDVVILHASKYGKYVPCYKAV